MNRKEQTGTDVYSVSGMARYLSQTDVWAIAFGCIIGWGAFVMPGTTFLPIAGPAGTLIAMGVSALIMLVIGSNYAYLMNQRPGTGGVYAYTREAFGQDHAFLCSWFLSLSYISIVFLNATALFVVSRTLFGQLLQVGLHYRIAGYDVYLGEVCLSIGVLVLIGILFILRKPLLQRLQTILALILLLGSLVITVACLPRLQPGDLLTFGIEQHNRVSVIMTIVLLSPWAFVGFDVISLETAHFQFPAHKSRRIIFLAILLGAFVYASMSLVSITSAPDGFTSWQDYIGNLDQLAGVDAVPTFYAAKSIMGLWGMIALSITALCAILTGVIGAYRATTRVLSTMAEDRILSEKFTSTSFCVAFIMIISIVVSFLGRNALEWFVELTTFGAIVGFAYTSASAYRIAKSEGNRRIMCTGIVGTGITAAFAVVQLVPKLTILETMGAASFLMLSLWCLLGFAFYWRTMRNSDSLRYHGAATSSTVLFSLLLYCVLMWYLLRLLEIRDISELRNAVLRDGIVLVLLVAVGLVVMLYIQNLLRERHEILEREIIHAEESSRAKTQFLFNMSHDIRTPMNAIIGYTNVAIRENRSPVVDDYLRKIRISGRQLLELIDDILEMSRIENGRVELEYAPVDLPGVLSELQDLFRNQMKEKEISFTVAASQLFHPVVLCDQKNLNRVLLNIVSNAYKFTPVGGDVSVSLREEENSVYELRVRDSGIGMSEEFAEKIFNAFERERTSTVSGIQGTGLGMAISKQIIDMMGGTIEVETAPGQGTEIIIRLELQPAELTEVPEETLPTEAQATDASVFRGKRVLLVEDNYVNREIASLILQELGFVLEYAEDGQIAVNKVCDSEPGDYDLILMDIQMPNMDGYTAARTIRALENPALAGIPIVAMTANAFQEDIRKAKSLGMNDHIAKPLDVTKMTETLRRVLEDRK